MSVDISINNLYKKFGEFTAVNGINLKIESGKFITLLGASGCGKTTTLRMLAGFIEPNGGEIYFDDKLMNHIPPDKRNISMVFQSYALFPHKTVYDNVNFGLKMRKVKESEQKKRIAEVLEMVNLSGLENRKPFELSGGQQQRVALARAMVVRPQLLLFDEPLSNLDAKLREKVRMEIRDIQSQLGITTVYVTHDQEEALSISDKIVVMNGGQIQQVGTPEEVYKTPSNIFIADFMGSSNLLEAEVTDKQGEYIVAQSEIGALKIKKDTDKQKINLCIRPEDITIVEDGYEGTNIFKGIVKNIVFLGKYKEVIVETKGQIISMELSKNTLITKGDTVSYVIPEDDIHVIEEE